MNYNDIPDLYNKYKEIIPSLQSLAIGTFEDDDENDVPHYIFYLDDIESPYTQYVPSEINGVPIKIKEWRNIILRSGEKPISNAKRLYNTVRQWTGSAGFVVKDANNNHYLSTNYHVCPDLNTPVTYNGEHIGDVSHIGVDKELDVSFILLNSRGRDIFPLSSSLGFDFKNAELNETIFADGSYGEPIMNRVVSIGQIAVNDPILGKLLLFGNTARKYNNYKMVISGDSGCIAYVNYFGQNYITGIMNGSNGYNASTYVPIDKILASFPEFQWGDVIIENNNQALILENQKLQEQYSRMSSYYRQMRVKLNETEMIKNDISHKFSIFLQTLEPESQKVFTGAISSGVK